MPRDDATSTVDFEAIAARRHMLQRRCRPDMGQHLRSSYGEDLCLLALRDPRKTQEQRLALLSGWLLMGMLDEEQAATLADVFGLSGSVGA